MMLDKLGFRSSILPELLVFGETHPEVQREFSIIALGSIALVLGDRDVPYLDVWHDERRRSGRGLGLSWFEDRWNVSYRFAAVRK
jgi:hypothetical protein